jgi:ADP-ribose pyrophosphatase YjhB (NUDIX family)
MGRSPFFAGWRSCPRCGEGLHVEDSTASCPACGLRVYANPAPTASALVLDERGRVLLARRRGEPGEGLWDIPGGFVDEGEAPLETLRRELDEEAGVEIAPDAFLGGFPDRYGEDGIFTMNLYWTARIVSGEPEPADDVAELVWFGPEELPPRDEFAFGNSVEVLDAWRKRVRSEASRR